MFEQIWAVQHSPPVSWVNSRDVINFYLKNSTHQTELTWKYFCVCVCFFFFSLIREFPLAGVEWPGGILADEMGLGKTVEVLALILFHTRQGLEQESLTLPVVRISKQQQFKRQNVTIFCTTSVSLWHFECHLVPLCSRWGRHLYITRTKQQL